MTDTLDLIEDPRATAPGICHDIRVVADKEWVCIRLLHGTRRRHDDPPPDSHYYVRRWPGTNR